ncbi:hypothetical protein [Flavobacterium sp.]|uniref:hypothetical protein n=1 Tax=Flavobacterium sp. TaxID=239 RepID=UPI002488D986|nr:hypothetical protein [Flavobacterium sp.]MDI1316852.1 hypothetical protein [Flavobacterium sp.]
MKKVILIILILFINSSYSQNYNDGKNVYSPCNYCKGTGVIKIEKWVPCYNCKSFNQEFNEAIQEAAVLAVVETVIGKDVHTSKVNDYKWCNVCENKKGKYEIIKYECKRCGGRGKIKNSNFTSNQNESINASEPTDVRKKIWIKLKLKEREKKEEYDKRPFKPGSEAEKIYKEGKLKDRGSF